MIDFPVWLTPLLANLFWLALVGSTAMIVLHAVHPWE